jgi:Fur family ferric uptake transcriptional regulator
MEYAQAKLVGAGHKRGGARHAVIELLARQNCAMSAQEIDERLRAAGRGVGRASVYRALEALEGLKLVTRIEVGQGVARYEPALPSGDHHHHLVCDSCGRVEPFEDRELERTMVRLAQRLPPFKVEDHEVVLHGECSRCAS